jgi:hypothetical protein
MAELPAQSRFCLRCGTPVPSIQPESPDPSPVSQTPFEPAGSPGFARPSNRGLKIALAGLILAIAALSAMVVHGGLLHSPGSADNGSLVNAPGQSGVSSLVQAPGDSHSGPLVQSPGTSQAPPDITQKPGEAAPPAADVEDYLRFLKDVEKRKMSLIKDFTTRALMQSATEKQQEVDAASNDDASKQFIPNINKGNEDFAPKWDQLAKYFLTKTPPQSCRELQQKYYDHLGKIESMFTQLHNALEQASSDPGKALSALTEMQGKASSEADDSARSADDALADVCDKYRIRKDFDIKTDSGSSSSLLP